jgi:hypothetical protein
LAIRSITVCSPSIGAISTGCSRLLSARCSRRSCRTILGVLCIYLYIHVLRDVFVLLDLLVNLLELNVPDLEVSLGDVPGVLEDVPGVLEDVPGVLEVVPGVLEDVPGVGVLEDVPSVLEDVPGVLEVVLLQVLVDLLLCYHDKVGFITV